MVRLLAAKAVQVSTQSPEKVCKTMGSDPNMALPEKMQVQALEASRAKAKTLWNSRYIAGSYAHCLPFYRYPFE